MPYRPLLKLRSAAGGKEADQGGRRHDQDGDEGGLEAQGDAADDDGGRACLRSGRQLLGGLVGIGGVVFGEIADGTAAHQTGQDDATEHARVAQGELG